MTVERETTVQLAHAEMNDEYGVDFAFLGTRGALTADEALQIAEELSEAAREAQAAAVEYASRPLTPEAVDLLGALLTSVEREQLRRQS